MDIKRFICGCHICQHVKDSISLPLGRLVSLPIPYEYFSSWKVDLITSLIDDIRYSGVFVCMNKLARITKLLYFPVKVGEISALTIAKLFIANLVFL